MYPHLWASSVRSSRRHSDVTVCFCVHVCITLAGLVQFRGCVCIHHSENVCVECICVSVNSPPFFFLPFSLSPFLSGCLCVSALNEYSHRINSRMIKQLQLSTYVKHRGRQQEMERERERDGKQKETERIQKNKRQQKRRQDRKKKGVKKKVENVKEMQYRFSGLSGRLEALPRPSSLSLGRPCSPLSALGERKRTKDLLLGPDLYTFLVLFFSPRPLGHTKGL